MPNRLADETSPYLLQHANNPVDWYAWGDEALTRARAENKPILLSVGYSACHWCHVMERESFENPDIAALMNEHFVSIKVDREERPDVDSIYMQAVQSLTGRGGWPMTVFLTPDGRPFHGGTYYPPEDRQGMPGFPRILQALAQAYRERPEDVERAAARITEGLRAGAVAGASVDDVGRLTTAVLDEAAQRLAVQFDAEHGGFGGAPKFPAAMTLDFLLRHHARTGNRHSLEMVTFSLNAMARGGIYDQLGGGFHRYTVDGIWLVPHFEKMLYDNALLTRLYLHGFQATGDPFYRQIVEETLAYVLREMTHADGGFFSSQDADSEGEEGKFFVWTVEELAAALGDDEGALMARVFGAEARGNFEQSNVLHRPLDLAPLADEIDIAVPDLEERVRRARATLFAAREARVKPGRDDKILTAWNGMMLRALAAAAAVLERDDYRDASIRCAEFLTRELVRDGRVLRTWKDGRASLDGYLEDYALLADALLAVYELTFDARWLTQTRDIARALLARFWDAEAGVFYDTAADAAPLITRPRDPLDNATPSGTSVAASVLLKLGLLDGAAQPDAVATRVLGAHIEAMTRYPSAFGELLAAADLAIGPATELVVVGERHAEDTRALLREVYRRFRPNLLLLGRQPQDRDALRRSPLLEGREQRGAVATAYVCTGTVCGEPATSVDALSAQLNQST